MAMTTGVTRELVLGFFDARVSHDPARIAPYLDDNIDWLIAGPVDLLHFCGQRHGKDEVIDNLVRIGPSVMRPTRMETQELLVDGDRAASFVLMSGILARTTRTVSYRSAQFMRFRDRKIVEFRSLIDSFDAAEQVLGRAIEVSPAQELSRDVVMV
jgi:ketosteroid isomerase-like protein